MLIRCLAGLALVLLTATGTASADTITEDDVKLALSYKIARFVTWPESDERTEFQLCIDGERSFETAKARLTGRKIRELEIRLSEITDRTDPAKCHAIYITRDEVKRAQKYLPGLDGKPILVISDIPEFAEKGGMVGLSFRNKRVGMTINIATYQQAGLEFSSQLLELAELISQDASEAE